MKDDVLANLVQGFSLQGGWGEPFNFDGNRGLSGICEGEGHDTNRMRAVKAVGRCWSSHGAASKVATTPILHNKGLFKMVHSSLFVTAEARFPVNLACSCERSRCADCGIPC